MDLDQAIHGRRAIRRFAPYPLSPEDLRAIADAGRMAASAGNRQPCRFIAVSQSALVERMFDHVAWLAAAGDPPEGARPTAYMVILGDPAVNRNFTSDAAAAAQNILLAAHGKGLGSCWIGSVNRDAVRALLAIPQEIEIYAVIALGYPGERAVAVDAPAGDAVTRGDDGVLRVPKRRLDEVLRFDGWGD